MADDKVRRAVAVAIERLGAHPEEAHEVNLAAMARLTEGLTMRVEGPEGAVVETDMPELLGGRGRLPSPGWYWRAGMACCTATAIALRAAQVGVDLEDLAVEVESTSDERGLLGLDGVRAAHLGVDVRVRVSALGVDDATLREIAEWGAAHSSVADDVRRELPLNLRIEVH